MRVKLKYTVIAYLLTIPLFFVSLNAHAVPSFSRQTGMGCSGCHTIFPELTPFGRSFKLNGYTLAATPQVEEKRADGKTVLEINQLPPLSVILQTSYTATKTRQPEEGNSNVLFPQTFGLIYAGKIAPKLGAFAQINYDGAKQNYNGSGRDTSDNNTLYLLASLVF